MAIKPKAFQVTLSDGSEHVVHEPKVKDMGAFLRALPSLVAIARVFSTTKDNLGLQANIPDAVIEDIFPLLAIMTDLSVEEFKDLPLMDGWAVMQGLTLFVPKNPQAATVPATDLVESTPMS